MSTQKNHHGEPSFSPFKWPCRGFLVRLPIGYSTAIGSKDWVYHMYLLDNCSTCHGWNCQKLGTYPFSTKNTSIWSHGCKSSTQFITIPMNTFPFGDENPEIPRCSADPRPLSHCLQGTLWRCRVGGGWCGRATHWWHLTSVSLSRLRMAIRYVVATCRPPVNYGHVSCFCWTRQLDIDIDIEIYRFRHRDIDIDRIE